MAVETKARIWVYTPHHLHSGLTFPEAAVALADQSHLTMKAKRQLGSGYDGPSLMTQGGLEHPVVVHVDGRELPFVPEVRIQTLPPDERLDLMAYSLKEQQERGDRPFPKELTGRNFEVWGMRRYPNQEHPIDWGFQDDSSPLFDPEVEPDGLRAHIQGVYEGLLGYYGPLKEARPVVLGWYTQGDRFRIASRPNKLIPSEVRDAGHHKFSVATSLPVESR